MLLGKQLADHKQKQFLAVRFVAEIPLTVFSH